MKISIITVTYNSKSTIADCIRSTNDQTYSNIEHIIIDGASKDNTIEIIKSIPNRVSRIISEPDHGIYDAMNKGIANVTGDIIGILHSDDFFYEPGTIQKVVTAFQESGADLIYANGQYVNLLNPTKRDLKHGEQLKVRRIYRSKSFRKCYLPFGWIPLHTTIYVRKEVFEKYGLYEEHYHIASDYEISLRWFQNDEIKKVYLNEWVVKMRLGGKSTSAKLQKMKSTEDLDIIRRYKLLGYFTLACKITRKIPQYLLPRLIHYN
jgi:glycosyltransferase involved in cell wall biosynthesis